MVVVWRKQAGVPSTSHLFVFLLSSPVAGAVADVAVVAADTAGTTGAAAGFVLSVSSMTARRSRSSWSMGATGWRQ